ncbi:MAG TPA: hypothetical protein VNH11_32130 [Pirellulales bacterium]|nr:hypothetical protein [Pirellulales bacterium]
MTGWRNWLAFAALLALVSACALAVGDAATRPARLVDRLDHEALFHWLSTRDLGRELRTTKLRLARRLAEDFRQGYDWQYELAELDSAHRDRAIANLRELVPVWLLDRADRYTALTEPERTAFVDEQLDDLLYWPVWQRRAAGQLAELLPRNPALAVQQIDAWTDGLETGQRQRIQQFTGALYLRWL